MGDIVCNVPNVKDGPDVRLRYCFQNNYEIGDFIYGNVFAEEERTGFFILGVSGNRIHIKDYHPIGRLKTEKWRTNRGKGISQTFLNWLSHLAKINRNEIRINSNYFMSYHVFRKFFADQIQFPHLRAEEWHSFDRLKLYDKGLVGELTVMNPETGEDLAYVNLSPVERGYVVTDVRLPSLLKEGDVVSIDDHACLSIENDQFGVVAYPTTFFCDINLKGSPKFPFGEGLEAKVEEFKGFKFLHS